MNELVKYSVLLTQVILRIIKHATPPLGIFMLK